MSDYDPLLEALRDLKAQSDNRFEGLIRDCLETLSRRTLRLLKSGPQGGKDILSDADRSLPIIAIEAKRFGLKTSLPLDELKSKLREALQSSPILDVWGLVLSREMKEPDWGELQKIGAEYGVTLLCMDWRDELGSLPSIAAICCAGRHIAETRISGNLAPIFDRIESHPDFEGITNNLRQTLTAPETGLDLAREAAQNWLKKVVSSASASREHLRGYSDILSADAHYVARPTVERQIDNWWHSESRTPAVLLGNEDCGKTWVALKWCILRMEKPDPPLVIVISAKDINSLEDVGDVLAGSLSRCIPHVESSELKRRIERWTQSNRPTRILLIVDGLNEKWSIDWNEFVRQFEVEPWKRCVALLLTSRSAYWKDDLAQLQSTADQPITEIPVPEFTDPELDVYLAMYELARTQLPPGLLKLIHIPRFARLAIMLREQLGDEEELTEARLVLEDWRSRLPQRDLRVNDENLLQFVADLGKDVLANRDCSISQREIHARLSADSGRDLDHYLTTINEIIEGLWLIRTDRPHRYKVNTTLLPYVIGLDLARVIEGMTGHRRISANKIQRLFNQTVFH